MADTSSMADIRGINIDKAVTGFALREYVFKQICSIVPSSSWQEKYYKETAAELTAVGTGNSLEGVPRLANFPHIEPSWTLTTSYMKKHAAEAQISMEDVMTNDIDMMARTLLRVSRAIVKSVDTNIWDTITESRSVSTINSVTIASGSEWDAVVIANRDPLTDILNAKKEIYDDNYNPDSDGYLIISPKDYVALLSNASVRNAGQFFTDEATRNGKVGFLLGLKVLVSQNVTADYAAVVVGKEAATWREAQALKTITIENQGISYTIRAWEIGVCQLKNPEAMCLLINTQK